MQAVGANESWSPAAQVIIGPDPQRFLYGEAVVWFHKVDLFRHEEEQRIYQQNPTPQDLILHRELLLRLIADGEYLLRLIDQHGFPANAEGFTTGDLQATLQNLQADYRGWHEPMEPSQRSNILHEVFDVPKSAH